MKESNWIVIGLVVVVTLFLAIFQVFTIVKVNHHQQEIEQLQRDINESIAQQTQSRLLAPPTEQLVTNHPDNDINNRIHQLRQDILNQTVLRGVVGDEHSNVKLLFNNSHIDVPLPKLVKDVIADKGIVVVDNYNNSQTIEFDLTVSTEHNKTSILTLTVGNEHYWSELPDVRLKIENDALVLQYCIGLECYVDDVISLTDFIEQYTQINVQLEENKVTLIQNNRRLEVPVPHIVCPPGFRYLQHVKNEVGSCLMAGLTPLTRNDAQRYCNRFGASLLIGDSTKKMNMVHYYFNTTINTILLGAITTNGSITWDQRYGNNSFPVMPCSNSSQRFVVVYRNGSFSKDFINSTHYPICELNALTELGTEDFGFLYMHIKEIKNNRPHAIRVYQSSHQQQHSPHDITIDSNQIIRFHNHAFSNQFIIDVSCRNVTSGYTSVTVCGKTFRIPKDEKTASGQAVFLDGSCTLDAILFQTPNYSICNLFIRYHLSELDDSLLIMSPV